MTSVGVLAYLLQQLVIGLHGCLSMNQEVHCFSLGRERHWLDYTGSNCMAHTLFSNSWLIRIRVDKDGTGTHLPVSER